MQLLFKDWPEKVGAAGSNEPKGASRKFIISGTFKFLGDRENQTWPRAVINQARPKRVCELRCAHIDRARRQKEEGRRAILLDPPPGS